MTNELAKERWEEVSKLAGHTASKIIDLAADDIKVKAGMMLEWRQTIGALAADENTSPLEMLLIENVATSRLHLLVMTYKAEATIAAGVTLKMADHWEKRVNAAQRRHLRAVETLARVRKIERTRPLQVNVAQQQVVMSS